MAESPKANSNPDKTKKSRGLGAFLLFLGVLIVALFLMGPETYRNRQELSQDKYEYHLVRGDVESQSIKGESLIEGKLRTGKAAPVPSDRPFFKVQYGNLENAGTEFRERKAVQAPREISARHLMMAMENGWYQPTTINVLEVLEPVKRKPDAQLDAPIASTGKVEVFVHAHAIGETEMRSRWNTTKFGEFDDVNFPMPPQTGSIYLEVIDVDDMVATLGSLEAKGAERINHRFDLTRGGTIYKGTDSLFGSLLLFWGPWILIFAVFFFFMRQMRSQGGAGGVMSFGRSRAQLYSKENNTNVTFDDVAGAVEAKDEVREIVEFLKNPSRFTRIGGRIPRGVLLVGPPGCGKTLLAKAIAGEAEVPFFSISGSDFVEMFVGVGASRVRDLFKQARENSPCIIFLDEIDAVGRRRGSGMGGGHDEREQTLNAILVEMDGFSTDEGIIVVAATNRPDVLDPALLRPGRFDRQVDIDFADAEGRSQILRVHMNKVKHGEDVDIETLARSTPGYSGADLAAIINEAAIRAALDKREEISMADLEESRDKVRYGRQKKSRKFEEADRRITAYHEAGHAIVAASIDEIEKPHKVTIVPRGRALGATMILPDKESYHMQKKRMLGQLAMLFGGRVAEAQFCGDISAGASDDIKRATGLARAMVTELGMSDEVGPVNYAEREGSDFLGTELMRGRSHSEDTAREIDKEIKRMLDDAYERADAIVREKSGAVEQLAEGLLVHETLNEGEIQDLLNGVAIDQLRPAKPEAPAEESEEARESKTSNSRSEEGPELGDLPGEAGLSPA